MIFRGILAMVAFDSASNAQNPFALSALMAWPLNLPAFQKASPVMGKGGYFPPPVLG